MTESRVIRNEDIRRVTIDVPEGHQHLRTTIALADGSEIVFQEATLANLSRAYVSLKTHPTRRSVVLVGREVSDRKSGFASWQLLEEESQSPHMDRP